MKAPDKVYIDDLAVVNDSVTKISLEQLPNFSEYIRKDALMEWVYMRLEQFRYIAKISNDVAADGEVDAFEELIDKLNSM